MQRYIRLYILVILLFLASLSQVSAVETTEDFEGSSLSSDQCVSGGSAIEAFKFMNSNSEGACLSGAEGASGSKGVYSNYSAGTSDYLTMYLTTGAAFKFVSVYIDDVIGYGSPTYWVAGYSGGSQTEGPDTINVRTAGVHTFNWGNVDSVRFNAILKPDTDPGDGPYTDTLDVAGVFDNITYDSPVAGNTNPSLSTNNGLQLNEGATATIPIDSLEYTDAEQDDATLTYTITDLADHGATKNNGSTLGLNGTFTQSDVTNNLITYVHDGSNTTSDSFIFSVADGVGGEVTNQTFNITIVAIDDDTPTISTNNGLKLNEGATKSIPLDSLEANDTDTDNATLTYTLTSALSNGQAENTDNPGVSISSFTQQNLIDGKIQYVHDGTNTTSDSFTFKVADGVPNELTGQTFSITVVAVDDDTPTISTNNGLKLNEGATKSIPLDSLEANDTDTDNLTLTYTLTSGPANGQTENTDNPGVSISSFTQQNLTDGKIQYVHDGSNTTSDSFTFKVADGVPNELTGQTFSITVTAVDDDTPTISTNNGLKLNEGATKSIPLDSLEANDTDTDNLTLTYTLTSGPANGQTENTDNPGVSISSFTQQNLIDGKIQYVHDGTNTTSDSFTFKVADGVPNELTGQTFSITVTAVDDDTPTISTNNGLTLAEGATKSIPLDSLEANDADTDNSTLTYTLTLGPANGQTENTDNPGVSISSFTQQNLIDGKIQYVHDGTNTTSDSFTFKVADGVPNELTGQTFSITVTAVDDDIPTISVNNGLNVENGGTAAITTSALAANDTDSDNASLTFTVTASPGHGQLENTDSPSVSISSFSQQNLSDGKVRYVHDGSASTSDNFTFKVADGGANELTGQLFNITISAQTYTVTYLGNGSTSGTPPTDASLYHQGETVYVLNLGSLVKEGYIFNAWNTAANGSGSAYSAGNSVLMGTENIVFYAQWTEKKDFPWHLFVEPILFKEREGTRQD